MYALKNEIMRSKFKNKNIADALLGNFILTISSGFFSKKQGNVYALVVLYFVFNGDFITGGYIKGVCHILPTRSMESIYNCLFSAVYYRVFLNLISFLKSVQNKLTMFLNYKMILYSVSFF